MKTDDTHSQVRFLIIGLPRSGTTYLMSLLNSHPQITCAGEIFNPYGIVGVGEDYTDDQRTLGERDRAPRFFSKRYFDELAQSESRAVGYKYMIGHNIRVLTDLPEQPDLKLIYIHRRNKLAQVSSLIKADKTQRWAQENVDRHVRKKINVPPERISHYWHEFETQDFLFTQWFQTLQHQKMTLEYRDMFKPDFKAKVCDFLGVEPDFPVSSTLVKQGSNTILDRFENKAAIQDYFTNLGLVNWLDKEIDP